MSPARLQGNVARLSELVGLSAAGLVAALEAECRLKEGAKPAIGFAWHIRSRKGLREAT